MQVSKLPRKDIILGDNCLNPQEDLTLILATDGRIVNSNSAYTLLGYNQEEFATTNIGDLLKLDTRQPIIEALQNSPSTPLHGTLNCKNGRQIPVKTKSVQLLHADQLLLSITAALDCQLPPTERYFDKVRQENEYLLSFHNMSLGLIHHLDMDELLQNLLVHASKFFDTPDTFIYLYDEEDNILKIKTGTGRKAKYVGYSVELGSGVAGLAAKTGEPYIIENYTDWPGRLPDSDWNNLHTCVGIPLKTDGRITGVIGLDFFDKPRTFTADELPILSRFAELASITLANAWLHSSLAKSEKILKQNIEKVCLQNEYLSSLHEISLGLINQLDLDELLNKLLLHACSFFGTPDTFIYLYDETACALKVKLGTGRTTRQVGYTIKIGDGVAGRAAETGEPYIVENYSQWCKRMPDSIFDDLQTCVGIPLKTNGTVVGVLGIDFYDQPRSFSEDELPTLSHFAELASIALTNARLHSHLAQSEKMLQHKNEDLTAAHEELMASEEELRQQFNELMANEDEIHRQNIVLAALHHTALGLMNRLELNDLLKQIISNATELLNTPHGLIDLLDEERQISVVKVATGLFSKDMPSEIQITSGLIGEVYRTGSLVATDDYNTWEHRIKDPLFDKIKSYVRVPLKIADKIIGTLGLAFSTSRKLTDHDLSLLTRFAELASMALDNASLVTSYKKEIEYRRKTEEALRISETSYRAIFEAINDPIYLYSAATFEILYANTKAYKNYGYTRAEPLAHGLNEQSIGHKPYRREEAIRRLKEAAAGKPQLFEWIAQTRNGDLLWEEVHAQKVLIENRECVLEVARDISERKKSELELRKSEASNKALINAIPDPMLIISHDGTIIDFKGNKERLHFLPARFLGKKIGDVFPTAVAKTIMRKVKMTIECGETRVFEYEISGKKTEYFETRIVRSGDYEVLAIIRNITDRKLMEVQLKHLSLHDSLTGLYNRAYFEEGLKRLEGSRSASAGLMICDVDGLKIINDTLGHNIGDIILKAVAAILKNSFHPEDLVARIGGDEFAALLPHNSLETFEAEGNKIRMQIEKHNLENPTFPISLSIGFAVSVDTPIDINNLFKEADNNMYREKLHRHKSGRSAIVQALMKALEARDFITEGHGDRLQGLIVSFAGAIGLPERELADLRLLAKFHDIGKVGIPDSILFKPGKLTEDEFAVMRQHCEIGYRIAKSAPDLVPIADWILKHQEWWNGNGYPLGIKGRDIPLACRMLSIVDAYDAMTSDRPYRKALNPKIAINELKKCAGSQFDPELVGPFISVVNKMPQHKYEP